MSQPECKNLCDTWEDVKLSIVKVEEIEDKVASITLKCPHCQKLYVRVVPITEESEESDDESEEASLDKCPVCDNKTLEIREVKNDEPSEGYATLCLECIACQYKNETVVTYD